jgi:hypothetical protein
VIAANQIIIITSITAYIVHNILNLFFMKDLIALRYPIGNFEFGKTYTISDTRKHIDDIAEFPKTLKKIVKKLRDGALDRSYRPHGWTVRQVIHHLADSHMHAYIRMKLALTENTPVIKTYEEKLWAEMEDAKHGSVKSSMKLLSALHQRWVDFLYELSEDDLQRGYYNPVSKRTIILQEAISLYAWHTKHHLGHIKIVADGKAPKIEKKHAEDTPSQASSAPQKRVMSEEHKAKIQASRAAKSKPSAEVTLPAADAKRSRRSSEEVAAEKAAAAVEKAAQKAARAAEKAEKAAAPKMSRAEVLALARAARKPKEKPVVVAAAKRARRSSEEVAAEKAEKAAAPKMSRAEVLALARAARKPKEKPVVEVVDAAKRARRSSEEVAAEKAEKAAVPKMSRAEALALARAARKPKAETAVLEPEPQELPVKNTTAASKKTKK